MTVRDLTMTAAQADMLRSECTITGELEGACQILCSATQLADDPWSPGPNPDPDLRLAVHQIEPLPPMRVRRRQTSVSWDMDCYIELLRKARQQDLHPGSATAIPTPVRHSPARTTTTKLISETFSSAATATRRRSSPAFCSSATGEYRHASGMPPAHPRSLPFASSGTP